jgi:DNA-binding MarR family transcriptional regulator
VERTYKLGSLLSAMEKFRDLDKEMPLQLAAVFCVVARAGKISMADLKSVVDVSQATVSRNVAALSKVNRFKGAGHALLETRVNPLNFSHKDVSLTPRGQQFAALLEKLLS